MIQLSLQILDQIEVGGQAVLGRQLGATTPWPTERHGSDATTNGIIGAISGRYYAMDRDKRWDRVQTAYDVLIGNTDKTFTDIYIISSWLFNN